MAKRGNGEGSIYQRKEDGKWVGSVTLENGKRKVFYGKTRGEVAEKLKKALYEQQQGMLPTSTSKQTVEQFLLHWLESTQEQSVKPRTYERYEEIVRLHLIPSLGRYQLQKLTAQHVQSLYVKKQREGLSSTTVNTIHNVFHKALSMACKWELVSKNVCELVSPPPRKEHDISPLTIEQVHKLLAVAKDRSIEALLKLALTTGMRRGELLGLKWQDINLEQGLLQVRHTMARVPRKFRLPGERAYQEATTKTKRSRRGIILIPLALDALKQHRERQLAIIERVNDAWTNSDLVFCTSLGTPLNPSRDVLEPFKALLKEAALPDIRFHDLRHSAATLLLSLGIHPKIVQEILGHSNINMTLNVYSHVLPTMQKEAMDKLSNLFEGNNDNK
jgi:integrase